MIESYIANKLLYTYRINYDNGREKEYLIPNPDKEYLWGGSILTDFRAYQWVDKTNEYCEADLEALKILEGWEQPKINNLSDEDIALLINQSTYTILDTTSIHYESKIAKVKTNIGGIDVEIIDQRLLNDPKWGRSEAWKLDQDKNPVAFTAKQGNYPFDYFIKTVPVVLRNYCP